MLTMTIGGTLGRDPETRAAGSTSATTFSVAVHGWDSRKKEQTTTWIRVTVWGQRGETVGNLVRKGDRVMATGIGALTTYTGRDGVSLTSLELNASDLSPMGKSMGGAGGAGGASKPAVSRDEPGKPVDEDDIPFIRCDL